jgi:hypothetical protein
MLKTRTPCSLSYYKTNAPILFALDCYLLRCGLSSGNGAESILTRFFGGSRREQKPLLSVQGSVSYTLRPRTWVAVNASYYSGRRTIVNGVVNADRQGNSRVGVTGSIPLNQHQSIKVAVAKGVTTRIEGHLNTVAVAWQYSWLK